MQDAAPVLHTLRRNPSISPADDFADLEDEFSLGPTIPFLIIPLLNLPPLNLRGGPYTLPTGQRERQLILTFRRPSAPNRKPSGYVGRGHTRPR